MTYLFVKNFLWLLNTHSLILIFFYNRVVFLRKQIIQLHSIPICFLLSLPLCVVIYSRICSHRFGEGKKKAPSPPSPLPSNAPEQLVGFIALPRHWLRSIHRVRLIILIQKREDPACAFVLRPLRVNWRQQHSGGREQAHGGHATTPCPCQLYLELLLQQRGAWRKEAGPVLLQRLPGGAGQAEAVTGAEMAFHPKAPSLTILGYTEVEQDVLCVDICLHTHVHTMHTVSAQEAPKAGYTNLAHDKVLARLPFFISPVGLK